MIIKPRFLAANMTEVGYPGGTYVLFSYQTAVAAVVSSETSPRKFMKIGSPTRTTARHIAKWLRMYGAQTVCDVVPQEQIDRLASCSTEVWALREALKELGA